MGPFRIPMGTFRVPEGEDKGYFALHSPAKRGEAGWG